MFRACLSSLPPCSPLTIPPQILIVGTPHARQAISSAFSGLYRTVHSALTVDISTIEAMPRQGNWRYIACVSSPSELRRILKIVGHVTPSNFVIALLEQENHEIISAARVLALSAGGIGLLATARSLDILYKILEIWNGKEVVEEGVIRSAFGEPTLGAETVVPPSWDSEGKIKAVVDAEGLEFEQVCRLARDDNDTHSLHNRSDVETVAAKNVKASFLEEENQWLRDYQSSLENQAPGNNVNSVDEVSSSTEKPIQSDFFQKLLAGSKPE